MAYSANSTVLWLRASAMVRRLVSM